MTKFTGQLHKMAGSIADPIQYNFVLKKDGVAIDGLVPVNEFLGQKLGLDFSGKINCIACNRAITKTFQQGYCFPCAKRLAATDLCIVKPQNCHFHLGTCRQPDWGQQHCFIPHIVYLANSSGLKVGVTRETQIPTRWIDQGAIQALPILRVQSRHQAGLLEVAIAKLVADKTDWRKMLRGGNDKIDMLAKRDEIFSEIAISIQEIAGKFKFGDIEILTAEPVHEFSYPVLQYPDKITSLDLDKTPQINCKLQGVKGQYLLFDSGVINLRKYTGYEISIEI
jgi:hypothetical protein